MVRLASGFCIDATEVTRGQYRAWLATRPSFAGQPAACSSNRSFLPDATCGNADEVCQAGDFRSHPVVCVDWCDAEAYCRAAGKHLCGSLAGGSLGYFEYDDVARSQWLNACESGGSQPFPYGSEPRAGACNTAESDVGSTWPVGASTDCQSPVAGYAGVFDLSANVWEWEDACNDAQKPAVCRVRGGSYRQAASDTACQLGTSYWARLESSPRVGFRCCAPAMR